MTILTPKSIQGDNTHAIEEVSSERLEALNVLQMISNIGDIKDEHQLDLMMEQYGVPVRLFDISYFNGNEKLEFLQKILSVAKYSGTEKSIVELCVALGAESATVSNEGWSLLYSGECRADGLHKYDGGEQHRRQAVIVTVNNEGDNTVFEERLREAFKSLQPTRLYLQDVVFFY